MTKRKIILEMLKKAAIARQDALQEKVEARLTEREQRLLAWVFEQYQDNSKRRWFDPYHMLYSTHFALDLIEAEELNRLIVSTVILHDIGYRAIFDKSSWRSYQSRITHMQEGTAIAAGVLSRNGYNADELEKVVGMIAVHDNPYLGIDLQGADRLGLRDCDRVWIMHFLSFYKDVVTEQHSYVQPKAYLHDRMIQFYGWDHPFGPEWAVTMSKVKENAQRIERPSYSLTQQYIKRQFIYRIEELQNVKLLRDVDVFERYLQEQVEDPHPL